MRKNSIPSNLCATPVNNIKTATSQSVSNHTPTNQINPVSNPISPTPIKFNAQNGEITHKNVLSKKVLETLNATQKAFGGSIQSSFDQTSLSENSQMSPGFRRSKTKIGGFARRMSQKFNLIRQREEAAMIANLNA